MLSCSACYQTAVSSPTACSTPQSVSIAHATAAAAAAAGLAAPAPASASARIPASSISAAPPRHTEVAVEPRRRLRALALAIWLGVGALAIPGLLLPAHAQMHLPHLGDGADLSASEERRIGDSIIRAFYRDPDYTDDAPLQAYVMDIWHPLLQAARDRGDLSDELQERFAWRILLGRDRSINAFALPGGYLGVHLGLIGVVGSRDELASVLAHELSHVTQRHIARLLGQERKNMPLLIGSMILGALAAGSNPDAAQALIVGGQAAAVQNRLSFSRNMEREADRVGYNLLAPAGFSPQGAVSMFQRLQQANRLNDNGSWPYLRTHPLTSERIADMQARTAPGQPLPSATLEHAMMAARAQVLAQSEPDRLRQWADAPGTEEFRQLDPVQQAGRLYAAALSQQQLRNIRAALQTWQTLRTLVQRMQHTYPHSHAAVHSHTLWLGAELALAGGQPRQALAWLDEDSAATNLTQTVVADHMRRPTLLLRTRAWLALGKEQQQGRGGAAVQSLGLEQEVGSGKASAMSDTTAAELQTWVSEHPDDAAAWRLLSQVWQAQGQMLRSLRAEAEAHVAEMDYAAALDRFKAGQDLARRGSTHAGDHIEAAIIDTRLRATEALLREQAREQ